MPRYHLVVALLKVAGVSFGVVGVAEAAQLWLPYVWAARFAPGQQPPSPDTLLAYSVTHATYIASALVLIFAAPFVARLCGERKPLA
jgi:hypothetical protein